MEEQSSYIMVAKKERDKREGGREREREREGEGLGMVPLTFR
jgi:hypothetical protein